MEAELYRYMTGLKHDGQRIDQALADLSGRSRSQIAKHIQAGNVFLDNLEVRPGDRVKSGQIIELEIPPAPEYVPEITPVEGLGIVYDDDDIVVVDKPAGVAAHTGPGWEGPTVTGALRAAGYRISTSGPVEREGIVHRLDVGTSGLMVVAKSEAAYGILKNDFRYRRVKKIYHALVQGYLEQSQGTIDAPIGRQPGKEFKFTVTAEGKPSVTHYQTIRVLPGATLVEVTLDTGRTHQIRVHFSALGHPCLGDDMYGAQPELSKQLGLKRQWLHAYRLAFTHPVTKAALDFTVPYAEDLELALKKLDIS